LQKNNVFQKFLCSALIHEKSVDKTWIRMTLKEKICGGYNNVQEQGVVSNVMRHSSQLVLSYCEGMPGW